MKNLLSFTVYPYCCVGVVCSRLQHFALQGGRPDSRAGSVFIYHEWDWTVVIVASAVQVLQWERYTENWPLKNKINVRCIRKFSSYLLENTVWFYYKDQLINAVMLLANGKWLPEDVDFWKLNLVIYTRIVLLAFRFKGIEDEKLVKGEFWGFCLFVCLFVIAGVLLRIPFSWVMAVHR
jgi:hypothetical protein